MFLNIKKYVLFFFFTSCQWDSESRISNNTELDCNSIIHKTFQNYDEAKVFIYTTTFTFHEKIETIRSSWIRSIAYYSCNQQQYGYLEIVTDKGNYIHQNVPSELWNAMKEASSYGKFYNQYIKGKYPLKIKNR